MTKDTKDNAVDLLPCPFCGEKPEHDTSFVSDWNTGGMSGYKQDNAVCNRCNLRINRTKWNTRATPSLETIIARIEAEKVEEKSDYSHIRGEFGAIKTKAHNKALDKAISIIREEWGK